MALTKRFKRIRDIAINAGAYYVKKSDIFKDEDNEFQTDFTTITVFDQPGERLPAIAEKDSPKSN